MSLPDHSHFRMQGFPDPDLIREGLEKVAEHGIPGPGIASVLDVGTEAFLRYFEEEILDNLIRYGGSTCRFFDGVYGSGKTHLLQLLYELALRRGMVVVRTELSHALRLEQWQLVTLYILQNMETQINEQLVRTLPNILETLRDNGFADSASLKKANLPHAGFQATILKVVTGSLEGVARERLRRYLLGERIGAGELRNVGIRGVKNPLSQRNAEQALKTVLNGLFYLGLPGTLLLFDETEKSFSSSRSVPSRKVQISANLIRRFIDSCTTGGLLGTVAVFAVLPGFLENCARIYPALGQRIQISYRDTKKPAWRWPTLPIYAVSSVSQPEDFLDAVIKRLEAIVLYYGGDVEGLRSRMKSEGQRILNENAGMGFRRDLMKALATLALERMRGGAIGYGHYQSL